MRRWLNGETRHYLRRCGGSVNGPLAIRDARTGDETNIVACLHDFAVFEKLDHTFRLTPAIVGRDFMGERRKVQCDVAEWEGEFAGLMVWFRTYATFQAVPILFLEDIFVRPEYRRRGIGKAFFRHLAQTAQKEGAARIDWIVLDWNSRAIEFYASLGAPIAKDWRLCRLHSEALEKLAR
jgi:GNAT superfamily N-acetyltransferase